MLIITNIIYYYILLVNIILLYYNQIQIKYYINYMIQNITIIIYTLILSLFLSLPSYLIISTEVLANTNNINNSNINNNTIDTSKTNNIDTNNYNNNNNVINLTNAPRKVFGEWALFKTVNNKKRLLCYIVSLPQKRYDNFNKRGQSFFSIIVEKDKTTEPEIFLSYGQIWKRGIKDAELDIVKRKFPIYTYEDKAWAYNKIDDKNIVEELKKSAIFTVNINFNNNKSLIDIYSLNGFNEAYNELIKGCR